MEDDRVDGDCLLVSPVVEGELSVQIEESDLSRVRARGQDVSQVQSGPGQSVEVLFLGVLIPEQELPALHVEHADVSPTTRGHHLRPPGLEFHCPDLK